MRGGVKLSKEQLLEVQGLKTYFYTKDSTIRAVDGVDLKIHPKEVVCIVGESGSGKSVTSLSVMGLISKTNGKIVDGEIIFDGRSEERRVGRNRREGECNQKRYE